MVYGRTCSGTCISRTPFYNEPLNARPRLPALRYHHTVTPLSISSCPPLLEVRLY